MTRGQVVAQALDRFDETWADHERAQWHRYFALEDDGYELAFDALDRLASENAITREQQREAFCAQVEHALDELVREFPIRAMSQHGAAGDRRSWGILRGWIRRCGPAGCSGCHRSG